MDFEAFNLHPCISAGLEALAYETPTPIQQQAIPPILAGRDVVGLAQTGDGKTAAFVLPLLQQLREGPRKRIQALILAPTRELAQEIDDEVQALGCYGRVRSLVLYGGVNINPQIEQLDAGVEVVIACPERLVEHLERATIDFSLLRVLILDEADQMLAMGFLPQIQRIVKFLPLPRQTLIFSATMSDSVRALTETLLTEPVLVQVGDIAPTPTLEQRFYPVAAERKNELLAELLYRQREQPELTLIFAGAKHRAKRLTERLDKWGYAVTYLHGDLSPRRQQQALDGFREGTYKIIVTTDSAAQGLDMPRVSRVINYDLPDTPEAYLPRVGRAAGVGEAGVALSLFTPEEEPLLAALELLLEETCARYVLEGFDYTA